MITRQEKVRKLEEEKRKQEAMRKWNQEILNINQKKIGDERRLRELQRQKLEESIRAQEEEKKHKQQEEKELKELKEQKRQKLEEFRKSQEKVKEERDRRFQENERRKKEISRKKQQEAAKLREEEKMKREMRRKLAEEQRDEDEKRRIVEEIGRWRREENSRRSKEERMKVPIDDQVKLETQRQRVEEVMRMSTELALTGGGRGETREGAGNSNDREDNDAVSTPTARNHGESDEEDICKENQQDQRYILERCQQEEESRREAQQARCKRYQEERQCTTLEDDLQKLKQKASALATMVDDAESVGTLDELDKSLRDNSMRDKRGLGHARKDVPLCADKYEGMTYLYNRLEEEKRKQLLIKKPKGKKSKPRKQDLLPKDCGLPYTKSLSIKAPRGVLEPIPFVKFDGSPCFGQGPARSYVIRR